jgi:hypothetical protein
MNGINRIRLDGVNLEFREQEREGGKRTKRKGAENAKDAKQLIRNSRTGGRIPVAAAIESNYL